MTDQTTNQSPQGPRLSAEGIATARQIAEWCEAEFDATVRTAKLQLIYVWILVVAGMITLLFLPVVVEWIDTKLLEEKLPKEVVDEANRAVSLLDTNYQKLLDEAEKLQSARDTLELEFEGAQQARAEIETRLKLELEQPFAISQPGTMLREVPSNWWSRFSPRSAIRTSKDLYLIAGRWLGQESLILYSYDGRGWETASIAIDPPKLTRATDTEIKVIEIIDAIAESPTDGLMAVGRSRGREDVTILLHSEDGEAWRPIASEQFDLVKARRAKIAAHPGGGFIIGGQIDDGKTSVPLIELIRLNAGDVWEVTPLGRDQLTNGQFISLHVMPNGTIIASVSRLDGDEETAEIFEGDLDGNWRLAASLMQGEETAIQNFVEGPLGLFAGGYTGSAEGEIVKVFRRTSAGTWEDYLPDLLVEGFAELMLMRPDGTIFVSGDGGIAQIGVDKSVTQRPLDRPNLRAWLLTVEGGIMLIESRQAPLMPVDPGELADVRELVLQGSIPTGFVGSTQVTEDAASLAARTTMLQDLEQRRSEQQAFLDSARQLERDQRAAITRVSTANDALEDALRTAEPVRQAISMGTRVAIIALLIFLVQIVVNRYRYLQRLAGFYRARSHAFQMIAAAEPDQPMPMLKDVTLTDLMNALSPDAIGFDKAADPPTHHVSSLLQTALKR